MVDRELESIQTESEYFRVGMRLVNAIDSKVVDQYPDLTIIIHSTNDELELLYNTREALLYN